MKPSRPRPDLLLVLARNTRHSFTVLTGTLCYRHDPDHAKPGDRHEPGTVLSPLFEPGGRYNPYADLHVRALLDVKGDVAQGRCYGWSYGYRPHTVDLPRAQAMAGMLRRTERQLAALARQWGTPTDFGAYVSHFAAALGVTAFAEHTAVLRPDGTHWRWFDVHQMREWIRHHEQPTTRTAVAG